MPDNNLAIWDRFADIDPKFTKPISGRDYKGTSPNPQYVIRCLTELFGPAGKGFGWRVVAEDFIDLMEQKLHWCRIVFWWRDDDGVHEVEEYGQTKAAYITRNGDRRVDEDAPKKSLTDAIVKGASHIGIAANIFLGRWDDQKYVAEVSAEYARAEKAEAASPTGEGLAQAWEDGVLDSLPENPSPRQKAEAFCDAICRDFAAKKGVKALGNDWSRRERYINKFKDAYPDLHEKVVDAYELKANELREAADPERVPA